MKLEIADAIAGDLREAFEHYEHAGKELGDDFIAEFRSAIDKIVDNPYACQLLNPRYRRRGLRRFPYGVLYWVDEPEQVIRVSAVMHLNRGSGAWRRRME